MILYYYELRIKGKTMKEFINILFICVALIQTMLFLQEKQPFKIWAWPLNAAIWSFIHYLIIF